MAADQIVAQEVDKLLIDKLPMSCSVSTIADAGKYDTFDIAQTLIRFLSWRWRLC